MEELGFKSLLYIICVTMVTVTLQLNSIFKNLLSGKVSSVVLTRLLFLKIKDLKVLKLLPLKLIITKNAPL